MQCRNCGHVRTRLDPLPETQCADCGALYPAHVDAPMQARASTLRSAPRETPSGGRFKWMLKLAAVLVIAVTLKSWLVPSAESKFEGAQIAAGQQPHVVLYATSWCGYCAKTRNLFRTLRLQYTEYDIEKDRAAYEAHMRLGGPGVPVIVIGQDVVHGFDEDRILMLLEPWLTSVTKS
jgi:glutaredoxin